MKACGESNVKNVTLELGGKNPLIIFDDCDRKYSILAAVDYSKYLEFILCQTKLSMHAYRYLQNITVESVCITQTRQFQPHVSNSNVQEPRLMRSL